MALGVDLFVCFRDYSGEYLASVLEVINKRARGFIEEAELKKALVYELKEVSKNK